MYGMTARRAKILRLIDHYGDTFVVELSVEPQESSGSAETVKGYAFEGLSGIPRVGDDVLVNTTAVDLGLGSGGYHFVIASLSTAPEAKNGPGHIMKLRYTPLQIRVLAAEEESSPHHSLYRDDASLSATPVVAAELHSSLPAVLIGVKSVDPGLRTSYVMTDGGALPIGHSRSVRELKESGLLDSTVTVGHAFGGDYEAVSIASGLLTAKLVVHSDVVVVSKGPGIVGTGTKYGNTALEQGDALNYAYRLGGTPVVALRYSEADRRERHRGISHHTLTVLSKVCYCPTYIALPEEYPEVGSSLRTALADLGLERQHTPVTVPVRRAIDRLSSLNTPPTTMGRGISEERAFFACSCAAGVLAAMIKVGRSDQLAPLGSCYQ